MMSRIFVHAMLASLAPLLLVAGLAPAPSLAHHSIGGEFDAEDEITIEAVVRELHLINPHTYMVVDVDSRDGGTEEWVLSFGPATKLIRGSGWTPDTLVAGDRITATGRHARTGNGIYVITLLTADGRSLLDELQE